MPIPRVLMFEEMSRNFSRFSHNVAINVRSKSGTTLSDRHITAEFYLRVCRLLGLASVDDPPPRPGQGDEGGGVGPTRNCRKCARSPSSGYSHTVQGGCSVEHIPSMRTTFTSCSEARKRTSRSPSLLPAPAATSLWFTRTATRG